MDGTHGAAASLKAALVVIRKAPAVSTSDQTLFTQCLEEVFVRLQAQPASVSFFATSSLAAIQATFSQAIRTDFAQSLEDIVQLSLVAPGCDVLCDGSHHALARCFAACMGLVADGSPRSSRVYSAWIKQLQSRSTSSSDKLRTMRFLCRALPAGISEVLPPSDFSSAARALLPLLRSKHTAFQLHSTELAAILIDSGHVDGDALTQLLESLLWLAARPGTPSPVRAHLASAFATMVHPVVQSKWAITGTLMDVTASSASGGGIFSSAPQAAPGTDVAPGLVTDMVSACMVGMAAPESHVRQAWASTYAAWLCAAVCQGGRPAAGPAVIGRRPAQGASSRAAQEDEAEDTAEDNMYDERDAPAALAADAAAFGLTPSLWSELWGWETPPLRLRERPLQASGGAADDTSQDGAFAGASSSGSGRAAVADKPPAARHRRRGSSSVAGDAPAASGSGTASGSRGSKLFARKAKALSFRDICALEAAAWVRGMSPHQAVLLLSFHVRSGAHPAAVKLAHGAADEVTGTNHSDIIATAAGSGSWGGSALTDATLSALGVGGDGISNSQTAFAGSLSVATFLLVRSMRHNLLRISDGSLFLTLRAILRLALAAKPASSGAAAAAASRLGAALGAPSCSFQCPHGESLHDAVQGEGSGACNGAPWSSSPGGEDVDWGSNTAIAKQMRQTTQCILTAALVAPAGEPGSMRGPAWGRWVAAVVSSLTDLAAKAVQRGFAADLCALYAGPSSAADTRFAHGVHTGSPCPVELVLPTGASPAAVDAVLPHTAWCEGMSAGEWLTTLQALQEVAPYAEPDCIADSHAALLQALLPCAAVAHSCIRHGGSLQLAEGGSLLHAVRGQAPPSGLPVHACPPIAAQEDISAVVFFSPCPAVVAAGCQVLRWAVPSQPLAAVAALKLALQSSSGAHRVLSNDTFLATATASAATTLLTHVEALGMLHTGRRSAKPPAPGARGRSGGTWGGAADCVGSFNAPGCMYGLSNGMSVLSAAESYRVRQLNGAASALTAVLGGMPAAGAMWSISAPAVVEFAMASAAPLLPAVFDAALSMVSKGRDVSPGAAEDGTSAPGCTIVGAHQSWIMGGNTPKLAQWASVASAAVQQEILAACAAAGWKLLGALAPAGLAWWCPADRGTTLARLLEAEATTAWDGLHAGQREEGGEGGAVLLAVTTRTLVARPLQSNTLAATETTLASLLDVQEDRSAQTADDSSSAACILYESLARAPLAWRWRAVSAASDSLVCIMRAWAPHVNKHSMTSAASIPLRGVLRASTHLCGLLSGGAGVPLDAGTTPNAAAGKSSVPGADLNIPSYLLASCSSAWAVPSLRSLSQSLVHSGRQVLSAMAHVAPDDVRCLPSQLRAHCTHLSLSVLSNGTVQPRMKEHSGVPPGSAPVSTLAFALWMLGEPVGLSLASEATCAFVFDGLLGPAQASLSQPSTAWLSFARLTLAAGEHPYAQGLSSGLASSGAWPLPDTCTQEHGPGSGMHGGMQGLASPPVLLEDPQWLVHAACAPRSSAVRFNSPAKHTKTPATRFAASTDGPSAAALAAVALSETVIMGCAAPVAPPAKHAWAAAQSRGGPLLAPPPSTANGCQVSWPAVCAAVANGGWAHDGLSTPAAHSSGATWSGSYTHRDTWSTACDIAGAADAALSLGASLLSGTPAASRGAFLAAAAWPVRPDTVAALGQERNLFYVLPCGAIGHQRTAVARAGVALTLAVLALTAPSVQCREAAETTAQWVNPLKSMLGAGVGHIDAVVRRACAQSLGELVRVAGHAGGLGQRLLKAMKRQLAQADAATPAGGKMLPVHVHSGALFALSCILRGARCSDDVVHLDVETTQLALQSIYSACTEATQPLRSWAMHAWIVALQYLPPRIPGEPYVKSTLSLLQAHAASHSPGHASGSITGEATQPASVFAAPALVSTANSMTVLASGAQAAAGVAFERAGAAQRCRHWLSAPVLGKDGGAVLVAGAVAGALSDAGSSGGVTMSVHSSVSALLGRTGGASGSNSASAVASQDSIGRVASGAVAALDLNTHSSNAASSVHGSFGVLDSINAITALRALQWCALSLGPAAEHMTQGSAAASVAAAWSNIVHLHAQSPAVAAAALGSIRAWCVMSRSAVPACLAVLTSRSLAMGTAGRGDASDSAVYRVSREHLTAHDITAADGSAGFSLPGAVLAAARAWGAPAVPVSGMLSSAESACATPSLWKNAPDKRVWWARCGVARAPPHIALGAHLACGWMYAGSNSHTALAGSTSAGTQSSAGNSEEGEGDADGGMVASSGPSAFQSALAPAVDGDCAAAAQAQGAAAQAAAAVASNVEYVQAAPTLLPVAVSCFVAITASQQGGLLAAVSGHNRAAALAWYLSTAAAQLDRSGTCSPGDTTPVLMHKPGRPSSTLGGFAVLAGSLRDVLLADVLSALDIGVRAAAASARHPNISLVYVGTAASAASAAAVAVLQPVVHAASAVANGLAGDADLAAQGRVPHAAFVSACTTMCMPHAAALPPAAAVELAFPQGASLPLPLHAALLHVAASGVDALLQQGIAGLCMQAPDEVTPFGSEGAAWGTVGAAALLRGKAAADQLPQALTAATAVALGQTADVHSLTAVTLDVRGAQLHAQPSDVGLTAGSGLAGSSMAWPTALHCSMKQATLSIAGLSRGDKQALAAAEPLLLLERDGGDAASVASVLRSGSACLASSPALGLGVACLSPMLQLSAFILPVVVRACVDGGLASSVAAVAASHPVGTPQAEGDPFEKGSSTGNSSGVVAHTLAFSSVLQPLLQCVAACLSGATQGAAGAAEDTTGDEGGFGLSLGDLGSLDDDDKLDSGTPLQQADSSALQSGQGGLLLALPGTDASQSAAASAVALLHWLFAACCDTPLHTAAADAAPFGAGSSTALSAVAPQLGILAPLLTGSHCPGWLSAPMRAAAVALSLTGGLESVRSQRRLWAAIGALSTAGVRCPGSWGHGGLLRPTLHMQGQGGLVALNTTNGHAQVLAAVACLAWSKQSALVPPAMAAAAGRFLLPAHVATPENSPSGTCTWPHALDAFNASSTEARLVLNREMVLAWAAIQRRVQLGESTPWLSGAVQWSALRLAPQELPMVLMQASQAADALDASSVASVAVLLGQLHLAPGKELMTAESAAAALAALAASAISGDALHACVCTPHGRLALSRLLHFSAQHPPASSNASRSCLVALARLAAAAGAVAAKGSDQRGSVLHILDVLLSVSCLLSAVVQCSAHFGGGAGASLAPAAAKVAQATAHAAATAMCNLDDKLDTAHLSVASTLLVELCSVFACITPPVAIALTPPARKAVLVALTATTQSILRGIGLLRELQDESTEWAQAVLLRALFAAPPAAGAAAVPPAQSAVPALLAALHADTAGGFKWAHPVAASLWTEHGQRVASEPASQALPVALLCAADLSALGGLCVLQTVQAWLLSNMQLPAAAKHAAPAWASILKDCLMCMAPPAPEARGALVACLLGAHADFLLATTPPHAELHTATWNLVSSFGAEFKAAFAQLPAGAQGAVETSAREGGGARPGAPPKTAAPEVSNPPQDKAGTATAFEASQPASRRRLAFNVNKFRK